MESKTETKTLLTPSSNLPRKHARQLLNEPLSLINYSKMSIQSNPNLNVNFDSELKKLGQGASGQVITDGKVAIKKFSQETQEDSIKKEARILQYLSQSSIHIVQFLGLYKQSSTIYLVQELLDGTLQDFIKQRINNLTFNPNFQDQIKIKSYMQQLFKALDHCHKHAIIHSDLKPSNIGIKRSSNTIKLIDFGHAQFYWPEYEYSSNISTVCFRAPELLFKSKNLIHYGIDIWAAGCIFLQLVFPCNIKQVTALTDDEQVERVLNKKFGSEALKSFCSKHGLILYELSKHYSKQQTWAEFLDYDYYNNPNPNPNFNKTIVNDDLTTIATTTQLFMTNALDLLEKLLVLEPDQRLTPDECLTHPFFKQ